MFDSGNNEVLAVIIAISVIVFFGVTAYVMLFVKRVTTPRPWTDVAIGVSAAVLAVAALFALF